MKSFKLFMEDCGCEDCSSNELFDHVIVEAEYQGRKVDLNNPFRLPSGSKKKFGVYAKNDKGNIVKVTFGDPNMEIKRDDPKRRASFRARHGCDKDPGPKWKAKYWSCYQWRGGAKVDEENPCWDGYKQVGMKKGRNGNMVPNCVPEETVKRLTGKAQEREYVKDIAHAMRGKGHENLKKYADEFEKAALKSLDPEKELKKILPTIKDGQLYNLLNMGESVSGAEKQPFVSKAGAGEFGTDKAKKTYLKDSPHAKIEKLTKSYVSEGKLKDMFTLHKKGMSPKEIAKKLKMDAGEVKALIHTLAKDKLLMKVMTNLEDVNQQFPKTLKSFTEVRQDKDIEDRKGTQPAKYYAKDAEGDEMSKSTKQARARHFDAKKKGPAPGDANAKTKPSKHTKKYHDMFGEAIEGLKKKSEKSGISYGILKKVYDRGMAAWKGGHRPGTTPQQWAFARVNSFITGGGARKSDNDLWQKHKGK